jgi:hypothetical protein
MAVYRQDEYAEQYRRGPGCWLGLLWLCATVAGSIAGALLSDPLLTSVLSESSLSVSLIITVAWSGLIFGITVGGAQSLVLIRYFKLRGALEWILATTLGRTVRSLLILILSVLVFSMGSIWTCVYIGLMAIVGLIAGLATGVAQRYVLERRVAQAHWWVLANVAASILTVTAGEFLAGLLVVVIAGQYQITTLSQASLWIGISTGLITGTLTGYALIDLMRHPTSRAEWSLGWKRKEPPLPRFDSDVQPSPEAILEQMKNQK